MYPYLYNEMRNKEGKLHVNGLGTLFVQPDMVTIHIGVISENANVQLAEGENTRIIQAILSAVKQVGIEDNQWQTTHFNIHPIYNQKEDNPQITSYQVSNEIRLTLNELEQISTMITLAIKNGANRINSLEFGLSNQEKWYQKALDKALVDAVNKAQSMAAVLNITINPTPIKITEESPQLQTLSKTFAASPLASPPIESGEITVSATVHVTFNY